MLPLFLMSGDVDNGMHSLQSGTRNREVRTISCRTGLVLEVRSLRKHSLVELLRADSAPEQPKGAARLSLGLQTVLAAILLAIGWGSCLFQPTQFMA